MFNAKRRQAKASDESANPILIFVAVALSAILLMVEADAHREDLAQIGLIVGSQGVMESRFVGP